MDDAELTRMAIEEIVRGMETMKEPEVQERKINPLSKPNKRFLGRTLNSMISHNKRKNDRSRANCRRKLQELDKRQKLSRTITSRSRSGSRDLALSSSSDGDISNNARKRIKSRNKTMHKKLKTRKKRSKRKKHKSHRSNSSTSSESNSESGSSTSSTYKRSKKIKKRKNAKHKKRKKNLETNIGEMPLMHYQPDINNVIQLNTALMANNYRQHQMQQLLYYSALLAGQENAEIEALKEELLTSDAETGDTNIDKNPACSVVSATNSDSESGESGVLQISLSSDLSTNSKAAVSKILQKNNKKENDRQNGGDSNGSSHDIIWNLDSDSSNASSCTRKDNNKREQKQNDEEFICLTSESESESNDNSESDTTASVSDIEIGKLATVDNKICQAEAETVTLLSSSDSEVEIVSTNCDDEAEQKHADKESRNSTPSTTEQLQELVEECNKSSNSEVLKKNDSLSTIKSSNSLLIASVENVSIEKEDANDLKTKNMAYINISSESSCNVEEAKGLAEVIVDSEKYFHAEVTGTEKKYSSPIESKSILDIENNGCSQSEDIIVNEENVAEVKESEKTANISSSLLESPPTQPNICTEQQVVMIKSDILDNTKYSSHILKATEKSAVNTGCLPTITSTICSIANATESVVGSKFSSTETESNKVVNESSEEEIDEAAKRLLTSPHVDVPYSRSLSASLLSAPPPLSTTAAPVVTTEGSKEYMNQSETNQTELASELFNL